MKLVQENLIQIAQVAARLPNEFQPDYQTLMAILTNPAINTILFDSDQLLELKDAEPPEGLPYRLPFPATVLQLTRPIPEEQFFIKEYIDYALDDTLDALILAQEEIDGVIHNQVIALFGSTAINRVYWRGMKPIYYVSAVPIKDEMKANKETLRALAVGAVTYINSVGMQLKRIVADPVKNRKRAAKGKRILPDYYTVTIKPGYEPSTRSTGGGTSHGHRYTVRGHWRKLVSGQVIWVKPHFRGLAHEEFIPSKRRVDHE